MPEFVRHPGDIGAYRLVRHGCDRIPQTGVAEIIVSGAGEYTDEKFERRACSHYPGQTYIGFSRPLSGHLGLSECSSLFGYCCDPGRGESAPQGLANQS